MEYVSIASAAATLCIKIVKFIRASQNVDQTFSVLATEVEQLSKVLDAIKTSFSKPALATVLLESQTGNEAQHWRHVKQALDDCKGTLQDFQKVLESVYKEEGQLLRRSRMLGALKLQAQDIERFRQQIGTYRETLTISLQWITLYSPNTFIRILIGDSTSVMATETTTTIMSAKLDTLTKQIKRAFSHFRKLPTPQESNESNFRIQNNLENCVRTAETLVISATTIMGSRSSRADSVLGEALGEHERKRVESWIMDPVPEESETETPLSSPLSSDASTLLASGPSFDSIPFTPAVGSSITPSTLPYRTTKLDESDIALIQLWRQDAVGKYNAQLFEQAEKLFEKILELSGAGANFPWKDETLRMLTYCYYHQKKWREAEEMLPVQFEGRDELIGQIVKSYCYHQMWEEAEYLVRQFSFEKRLTIVASIATSYLRHQMLKDAKRILNENMGENVEDTLEGSNMLHTLAEVYFSSKEFDKALVYCGRALRGRRSAVGNYHILYYQSIRLRVEIFKCTGESAEAEMCKTFLPDNFESMDLQIPAYFRLLGT